MTDPTQQFPPGWYDTGTGRRQWYDGTKWTGQWEPGSEAPVPATTPVQPPGWYPNAQGQQQWWDGAQWGMIAPPQAPQKASVGRMLFRGCTTMVALALLAIAIIWFIGSNQH